MNNENDLSLSRDRLIEVLVNNLPALRTKLGMTQSELADSLGIGRQTLLAIENKKGKMRWDTFLAIVVSFSKYNETSEFMRFLGLHLAMIEELIQEEFKSKKGGTLLKYEKIWTDHGSECSTVKAICPLPAGLKGSKCEKCGSFEITGAIITDTADEQDPNILCKDCGYWRD